MTVNDLSIAEKVMEILKKCDIPIDELEMTLVYGKASINQIEQDVQIQSQLSYVGQYDEEDVPF